ncbi:XRE family transcriptional regulator [Roseomonas sp. KE2513]|uniref:helix-turn-helix domain-containing protein n=1 Tax=Roseomonas sp. KE2513 TaxID=2479202 RepID=UPI0018E02B98|nr:helix-turn-helix transcriptional regulator [Roseomonas sp. KE2513]MBI0539437.1 XRE family transcriptional regulator [Roseomonas sp. KE2513]
MSWFRSSATLRKLLVEQRQAAGLSQAEFASRLGRPQAFVSRLESGQRRLDVFEFVAIAQALDLDPVNLFAEAIKNLVKTG